MTKELMISLEIDTVSDYWDGETYGDWSTQYSYRSATATLGGGGQLGWHSERVDVKDSVEELTPLWLVVVVYSSGNSFGNSSGNATVAAVCYSEEEAQAVEAAINTDYRENYNSFENIVVGDYEIYPYSWKGYFESLEHITIEKVRVETA